MTDNWRRFTNKMLFHSRTHVRVWQQQEGITGGVFRDACLHSMMMTYHSLLAEVLMARQIQVSHLPDLHEACILMQQKQEMSSELAYIRQLEHKPGWLFNLKRAYAASLIPVFTSPFSASLPDELALKPVDESLLTRVHDVVNTCDALGELVTYSRNYSLEW